ncbi:MAG: PIN domain-containing protein [Spirochaetales bacterium]|nr:PIN domain-containing protein [Spirochaetales bacterium]
MKIYFDVCCLNRPFDTQEQDRLRLEAEAILLIMQHCVTKEWEWVSSEVVEFEVDKIPDTLKKKRVQALLKEIESKVMVDEKTIKRALELEDMGIGPYDALHVACVEAGRADILLTVDDAFLKIVKQNQEKNGIRVENPVNWLKEVF